MSEANKKAMAFLYIAQLYIWLAADFLAISIIWNKNAQSYVISTNISCDTMYFDQ